MASASSSPRTTVPSLGCGFAVCAVLIVGGLLLFWNAERRWRAGRTSDAWLSAGFGAMACVAGAGLIVPMQRDVERARERLRRETARPSEPWTWDPAWSGRAGIEQSGRRHGRALVFFGVVFLALGVPMIGVMLPRELSRGNYPALLALVFPLFGLIVVVTALHDAWRRAKYGVARFVPAELPIPLGGEIAGMVTVDRPVLAAGPGRVALDCWRTTSSDDDGRRRKHSIESNASHTERVVAPADWTRHGGQSQLFLQLPVRDGEATTMGQLSVSDPIYEWRLRVETPTAGADFAAEFVLPVFPVAGVTPPDGASVAPPRAKREDIWRAAHVREELQPDATRGTALVLPVGEGRSVMLAPFLFAAVPAAVAVGLALTKAPEFIAWFFGLFALLPAMALVPLWRGGGERVWVQDGAICVQRRGALRRIGFDEVDALEARSSVGVGEQKFFRVEARRPAEKDRLARTFNVVSLVRGDEAATEIVVWLEERGAPPASTNPLRRAAGEAR